MSNIAITDMVNLILKKFSLVQVMTDKGLLKKVKFSQEYEDRLADVEKQFGRIMEGLKRMDKADNVEDLQDIVDTWLDIWERDLPEAQGEWARAYINKLYKSVKLPPKRDIEDE